MQALSIISLIFAILSMFIPAVGVFIAMGCSLLALISFRSSPTISGVTFGVNLISTLIFSPTLWLAPVLLVAAVGCHLVLMCIAFSIYFIGKKKPQQDSSLSATPNQ